MIPLPSFVLEAERNRRLELARAATAARVHPALARGGDAPAAGAGMVLNYGEDFRPPFVFVDAKDASLGGREGGG